MKPQGVPGYGSRKFVTVNHAMLLGTGTLIFGALVDVPDGYWTALPAFDVFLGVCVGVYQWANLRHHQHHEPEEEQ